MSMARQTECKRGHVFDDANTYVQPKTGKRYCRACRADMSRRLSGTQRRKDGARLRYEQVHGRKSGPSPGNRTVCPSGHPYDDDNTRWYQGRRYCKACGLASGRKLKDRNPESYLDKRAADRDKKYGMAPGEYDVLFRLQGGRCAICKLHERETIRTKLSVDHDHQSGAVRGLLCMTCNAGIGALGDSLETLRSAIKYLETPPRATEEFQQGYVALPPLLTVVKTYPKVCVVDGCERQRVARGLCAMHYQRQYAGRPLGGAELPHPGHSRVGAK